jgi:tRNA-guanine transglycosylases, various specificities
MGGLNQFTTWDRPMLTDSGGFQVFSLEGSARSPSMAVQFQSHIDGTYRTLTPEISMEIQWALGADIAMQFDHVVPGQAPWELAEEGMERSLRWLDRCRRRHEQLTEGATTTQTLWPIIQGGTHADLRRRSAEGSPRAGRGPALPSAGSASASRSR